jgi:PhzF family phenazine biosynthesis protein
VRKIKIFQVDSFADQPFKGNPAGVCILGKELHENLMQSVAGEMNLSETAFVVPATEGPIPRQDRFNLRWFTPTVEVDLCGHATLATARVLFDKYGVEVESIKFLTRSGDLLVARRDDRLAMDFPVDLTEDIETPENVLSSLGLSSAKNAGRSLRMNVILVEAADENLVRNMTPEFGRLLQISNKDGINGFIVTAAAKGSGYDFISRFFAPGFGINEDPVTGAAHTILGPYWAKKLGKSALKAFQASARGGEVELLVRGDRIDLIGQAVVVLEGDMNLT